MVSRPPSGLTSSSLSKSRANWLNRTTSKSMRHMLADARFFLWQKTASRPVPAHSKRPPSRETPKVIRVGATGTPTVLRKLMKLAVRRHQRHRPAARGASLPGALNGTWPCS